jgi:hypothetical protein
MLILELTSIILEQKKSLSLSFPYAGFFSNSGIAKIAYVRISYLYEVKRILF